MHLQFIKNHDWNAFQNDLKALRKRFSDNWKKGPAVDILMEQIEKRVNGVTPILPTDGQFNEKELNLGKQAVNIQHVYGSGGTWYTDKDAEYPWLVPDAWKNYFRLEDDIDLQIRALGLRALPLLIELSSCDLLTETTQGHVDNRVRWSQRNKNSTTEIYQRLYRPATVGELAKQILKEIVPYKQKGYSSSKVDYVAEAKNCFYEHIDGTPEKLAVEYVKASEVYDDGNALGYLLTIARKRSIPEFEQYLIESMGDDEEHKYGYCNRFASYAAFRKEGAQELQQKLVDELNKVADSAIFSDSFKYSSAERIKERKEQIKKSYLEYSKGLKALNITYTDEQILDIIAARDKLTEEEDLATRYYQFMLLTRLKFVAPTDAITLMINKAAENNSAAERYHIADLLKTYSLNNYSRFFSESGKLALRGTDNARQWTRLINDDRSSTNETFSVSELYLCLHENIYGSDSAPKATADFTIDADSYRLSSDKGANLGQKARELIKKHSSAGHKFVKNRVSARLKGAANSKLPLYPDEYKMTKEEIESVKDRFSTVLSLSELRKSASKLSIYEQANIGELLLELPKTNRKLAKIANTITAVDCPDNSEFTDHVKCYIGQSLDSELLDKLKTYCKKQTIENKPVLCLISRAGFFGGCSIKIKAVSIAKKGKKMHVAGIECLTVSDGLYGSMSIRTIPEPEKYQWDLVESSPPYIKLKYNKAISAFLCGGVPASAPAFVRFMTQGESDAN